MKIDEFGSVNQLIRFLKSIQLRLKKNQDRLIELSDSNLNKFNIKIYIILLCLINILSYQDFQYITIIVVQIKNLNKMIEFN